MNLIGRPIRLHCLGLALLLAAKPSVSSQSSESPSLFAANEVREALTEKGVIPEMSVVHRVHSELRKLVSHHLNSELLAAQPAISGLDFQYRFRNRGRTTQFGTIILSYPVSDDASKMLTLLNSGQKYFTHSEILIRFSATKLGNMIIVAYSENSGDKRIVDAIDRLPDQFAKATAANSWIWKDQDIPDDKP